VSLFHAQPQKKTNERIEKRRCCRLQRTPSGDCGGVAMGRRPATGVPRSGSPANLQRFRRLTTKRKRTARLAAPARFLLKKRKERKTQKPIPTPTLARRISPDEFSPHGQEADFNFLFEKR